MNGTTVITKAEQLRKSDKKILCGFSGTMVFREVRLCGTLPHARRVIDRCLAANGPSVLFAHGHILRVLAACWLSLSPDSGRLFALGTGSVSILRIPLDVNRGSGGSE